MANYYDRYEEFRFNGGVRPVPGIEITISPSDKRVVYKKNSTRLDKLSQKYYNDPWHGYLILLANPQYGGLEFDIRDRDTIRIPFPKDSAIERYINAVEEYKTLYG